MTVSELSPRQQRLAAASAAAAGAARASAGERQGRPPEAGDRYVLPATSDFPVEWVLLERHAESPAFHAVLADVHPLVDPADLPVPSGALRLRCRATTWLAESSLDPALRVGAIDRITLKKALRKVQELERGPAEPETSLESRAWRREVMAPALAALGPSPVSIAPPSQPLNLPKRTPILAAIAASLLLAAGLAGWAVWQNREIARLGTERRMLAAALEKERLQAAQALRSAEGNSQRRFSEKLAEERARVADLEQRLAAAETKTPDFPEALLNVPVAILNPAELLRGREPREVFLDSKAPYLTVALNLGEASYPSYRAIVRRDGSAKVVWQSDELLSSDDRLLFSLSPNLFPPGTYRIEAFGLRNGRAESLGDYELAVRPR